MIMKEFINSLTRHIIERTKNPYLRFILKKNSEQQKVKAYKRLSLELFLHTPGKNIRCLTLQRTENVAGIDEQMVWNLMEPYFYDEILKWLKSEDYGRLEKSLQME